jgi:hypothetical protein
VPFFFLFPSAPTEPYLYLRFFFFFLRTPCLC